MSKLADMMSKYADEPAPTESEAEAAAPETPTDAAPGTVEGAPAAGAAPSASEPARGPDGKFLPKDKADAKAEPEKPAPEKKPDDEADKRRAAEEQRRASQFAALSRKIQEQRQNEARLEERTKALSAREERVSAWEKALDDDEAFFRMLEKRGITADVIIERARTAGTPEARVRHVSTAWEKERDELRAEIKALRDEREQEKKGAVEASNHEAAQEFVAFLDADTDGKYAATAIYSQREAVDLANQIAAEAQERGEFESEFRNWGFDKIADALNKVAQRDARYKKLVGRQQQQAPSLLEKAASQDAPKAAEKEHGQQGSTATTLTNQSASERSNAGGNSRPSHKERFARLMARSD